MPKFTSIAVDNFKPGTKRREIPDNGCAGLYLVVQPTGRRSFAVRYRFAGKSKKLTLPKSTTLAAARAAATGALLQVDQGIDPSVIEREQKRIQGIAKANTFRAVCENYLKREGKKKESERLRSLPLQAGLLKRLVYETLGDLPIAKIKRKAVIDLLNKIEDDHGPVMAQSTLAVLRKIMGRYAVDDEDYSSPIVRGMARINAKARERSRVLSDSELRRVWITAEKRGDPFARLVQFLLLTGARRNEGAGLMWNEIADGDWILPAARNKVKVELTRPLSAAAMAIIAAQPRIDGVPFVFSYRSGPAAGASRHKRTFDAASGINENWTLHDLRRTARTLLSRAGINADVSERCLGHVIRGVRSVYDRHEFHAEKKHAFDALAAEIERIVNRPAGNVVALARS